MGGDEYIRQALGWSNCGGDFLRSVVDNDEVIVAAFGVLEQALKQIALFVEADD